MTDDTTSRRDENTKSAKFARLARRRLLEFVSSIGAGSVLVGNSKAHPETVSQTQAQRAEGTTRSVESLIEAMTLDEKIRHIHGHYGPDNSTGYVRPLERLEIPDVKMADGPVGVRQGTATAFPVGLSQASMWDEELMEEFGRALASEAKAKDQAVMYAPAFNIGRVSVAGRNFEYFGEDPYLASRMAVTTVNAIQSEDVIATAKHYVVNNQETDRMAVSAEIDERPLREIYLPAHKAAVEEADVGSVMAAHNRVNGTYCCENEYLLSDILKDEWDFDGYVISDFDANHSTVASAKAGLDLDMRNLPPRGTSYWGPPLRTAVEAGLVSEEIIDEKVRRILGQLDRFGLLEGRNLPEEGVANIERHQRLARQIAEEGGVLLKNEGDELPLALDNIDSIAVIGPEAKRAHAGGGGSSDVSPPYTVSPVQGIRNRVNDQATVQWAPGTPLADAVALAAASDVAIVVVDGSSSEGADRENIRLDGNQDQMISAVADVNASTSVVLRTGGPVTMPWISDVPAVLEMWYPGMEDGNATASILFGDVNPSGKLPMTFAKKRSDYPAEINPRQYPGIAGRAHYDEGIYVGYRHFDERNIEPLFPFGHGESFTTFNYSNLRVTPSEVDINKQTITLNVDVTNVGDRAGEEIVQVYVHDHFASVDRPVKGLAEFTKIHLESGETKTVELTLDADALSFYDVEEEDWVVEAGRYSVLIGRSSRDIRLLDSFEVTRGSHPSQVPESLPQQPTTPAVDGSRTDDATVFTSGQTNQIDLSIRATTDVTVRDRIPAGWAVIGGDSHEVYTDSGARYIEFDEPIADGTRTYFIEAPVSSENSGTYTFGPIEYVSDDSSWRTIPETADDDVVVGVDTSL